MIAHIFPPRNQLCWLILILISICSGCDQMFTPKDAQPSAPVTGRVLAGDQPVANAKILFLPLNASDGKYRYSYATTTKQGRFTMRLEDRVSGAHVGKNLVLISSCEKAEAKDTDGKASEQLIQPETISPRFNTASTLTIDVEPVGNADVVFQVDLLENATSSKSAEHPAS